MLRILIAIVAFIVCSRMINFLIMMFIGFWALLSTLILCRSVEMGYLASTDPTITGRFLFSMCIGIIVLIATAKIDDDGIAFGILAAGIVLTIGLCLPIF